MPVSNKEKCICQICICGEHRCEASKCSEFVENRHKTEQRVEEKASTDQKTVDNQQTTTTDEEYSSSEKERRKWETSPDQMREISRSLTRINGTTCDKSEKRDQQLVRSKRSTKEKPIESHPKDPIRTTLPPITSYNSDSDSGKEVFDSCICEGMYRSSEVLNNDGSNQWVVSRPVRNRPKDNLRLEGPMEMKTTFNSTYDSTAKQINDSQARNVSLVMPANKNSADDSHAEENLKGNLSSSSKVIEVNAVRASKKKPKYRPSTSLKAGGDGYFNTINQESYKNFVIIDDKSRAKAMTANGKAVRDHPNREGICCSTVSNLKLPKVDSPKEEKQISRRLSREEKASQGLDQMNRSMQRLTTSDRYESRVTQTNGLVDTSVQTNGGDIRDKSIETQMKSKAHENNDKTINRSQRSEAAEQQTSDGHSWTLAALEEPKRIYTRDVDNIKELHLMDEPNEQMIREIQEISDKAAKPVQQYHFSPDQTRNESSMSRHYVQSQTRTKKHKNESSMKLFDGDMVFTTTTRTSFADKSPNRADSRPLEREKTAGKRSRKSGRKGNLFRTSTEAQFYEPYAEHKASESTYRRQFGDRLYCPAIDLGSTRSEFRFKGEASGHKFFLPAVNN